MEDPEREGATDGDIDGLEEDALELSLGLRPAPIRRQSSAAAVPEEDRIGFLEPPARKEEQALRRQEARKKREEKRKLKANAVNRSENEERLSWFENRRAVSRESDGDFSERRRRKVNHNSVGVEGLPHLIMPGLVGSDGVGFRPPAGFAGGFRPCRAAETKSGLSSGGEDSWKRSVSSSSPGVSDYQSTSGQGGSSSDGGSHSSHSRPPDLTVPNDPTPTSNIKPCHLEPESEPQAKKSPNGTHKNVDPSKPPKPPAKQTNEALLLSQMPCVSATGNGPNGKTISGFLYRYTKAEVSIVCVCHGTAFSPAGFVEHAGGVAVENPLRRITVVPFASG